MKRRSLVASLVAASLLGARLALAATSTPTRRLGILIAGWCDSRKDALGVPLLKALAELGYLEGRNLAVEWRCFEMDFSRAPRMAAELARLRLDVLLTTGTPQTKALQDTTRTIPIVTSLTDPVASGFAKSLARPEGNVTGLCHMHPDSPAKQIELLRRIMPGLARLVIIGDSRYSGMRQLLSPSEVAARAAGMAVDVRMVDRSGYEGVFREMKGVGARAALIVSPDIDMAEVAGLANRHGVATVLDGGPGYVEAGGLMGYNVFHDNPERRSAVMIDKIFRGMKPSDIPWELPERTRLEINLRTAKALGLTVPADVLLRAETIIE